ncbi:MAG: DNA-processing protein DprA [Myxococcota bacterium]
MQDSDLWVALGDLRSLGRMDLERGLRRCGGPLGLLRRLGALHRRDAARERIRRAERGGIRALGRSHPEFPELLRQIASPPLVLWVRGRLDPAVAVAIVGGRKASDRGREFAHRLAEVAASAGVPVVSGLAYGIDAAAHEGALAGRGLTVAVLASGVDRPGPAGNRGLARRILDAGGACVSEHPPGTEARAYHFPGRNRLISGLARLALIVEARERSGSLWTARHAADQGRDVAVVPGPVGVGLCRGSNGLLREGAIPILEPDDLLDALGVRPRVAPAAPRARSPSPLAERVLEALARGPADSDSLARALGWPASQLAEVLIELELDGSVVREGVRVAARPALSARSSRPPGDLPLP